MLDLHVMKHQSLTSFCCDATLELIETNSHTVARRSPRSTTTTGRFTTVSTSRNRSPSASRRIAYNLHYLSPMVREPSTQTAPWLQAAVSLLAGHVTNATTATLQEANKVLRYAKENNDVGLEYRPLSASKDDITFIGFSDASFACRADLSSQGGYLVVMVDKTVAQGEPGHYNVLDWRSWKLGT